MFCPEDKCIHYTDSTKYGKKCYYGEPMCWKGILDQFLAVLKLAWKYRK